MPFDNMEDSKGTLERAREFDESSHDVISGRYTAIITIQAAT
jgi:hypothetical protein